MRRLSILFLAAALCGTARAAPASDASIAQLLVAMRSEAAMDSALSVMDQSMRNGMARATRGQDFTPAQRAVLEASQLKIARIMREELSWSRMLPLYTQIYRENFTQEDIDGLTAFYQSPAGAAFAQKMPIVMQRTMVLMQDRMGPMTERVQAAMRDSLEEIKDAR